jgi:hypothetical protein
MTRYLTTLANPGVFLNFYEGANLRFGADLTPIEIDKFRYSHVFAKLDVF